MNKQAIVAGHICIDITPVFASGEARKLSELLIPGKTVNMGPAKVNTGGAVANTGLAMKIFGADVSLVGKVGRDEIGAMILNALQKYEAQDGMLLSEEGGSSYTIVLAPPGVDRMFLHSSGLNDTFCSDDISDEMLDGCNLFHFGYPPLMRRMYENDGEDLLRLFRRVKEKGIITSLDFSAIDEEGAAGKIDWAGIVRRVLPYVDFFVPSLEELGYMIAPELYQKWQRKAGGGSIEDIVTLEEDVRPLADLLMSWGAKTVMIKCGAPGIYYRTAKADEMQEICKALELKQEQWTQIEGFEPSYVPECIRSATGAGDTSIGAFLTSVLRGYSLKQSVQMATAAGAACVEQYGALDGLQSFEALQQRINAGWKKAQPICD